LCQAVQKYSDARRAWFDKLTMTEKIACPEPVEGRGAAQPFGKLRVNARQIRRRGSLAKSVLHDHAGIRHTPLLFSLTLVDV
jgi:hypothetical protein